MKYQRLLPAEDEPPRFIINKKHLWKALAGLPGLPLHVLSSFNSPIDFNSQPVILAIESTGVVLLSFAGFEFFRDAWVNLSNIHKQPRLGMETLITSSSFCSYAYALLLTFYHEFAEQREHIPCLVAAPLITITAVRASLFLKEFVTTKISRYEKSLRVGLHEKLPGKITLEDGREIDFAELKKDMVIVVKQNETTPADGHLIEGNSPNVDDSHITGETNKLKSIKIGEEIFAGTQLLSSEPIKIKAHHDAGMSRLEQMIAILQNSKTDIKKIHDIIDKVTQWFVPGVLFIAVSTLAAWWGLGHNLHHAILYFINVLCAACPCALLIATPLSTAIAIFIAASQGILIRNANILAKLPAIKTIAFDKNGTLTSLQIESLSIYNPSILEQDIVRFATSLEAAANSRHPLALALQYYARSKKIETIAVALEESPHHGGLRGKIGKYFYTLGNLAFIQHYYPEITIPTEISTVTGDHCFLAQNDSIIACFKFETHLRPEAKTVIQQLKDRGYEIAIISGSDAEEIAKMLNITSVHSNKKPANKQQIITTLQQPVVFIGDERNDKLAAHTAFASISVREHSTLNEYVDAIIPGNLSHLLTLFTLSSNTMANVRQNIILSIVYNMTMIALAALILPLLNLELSPAVFGTGMGLSSVIVAGNAARLARGIRADERFADHDEIQITIAGQHRFIITNATTCCSAGNIRKLFDNEPQISNINVTPPANEECILTFTSTMNTHQAKSMVRAKLESSVFKLKEEINPNSIFSSTAATNDKLETPNLTNSK